MIIFGDGSILYMFAPQVTHVYSRVLLIIGGLSTTVLSLSLSPSMVTSFTPLCLLFVVPFDQGRRSWKYLPMMTR